MTDAQRQEFRQMINLRFFYSQEGNLVQVAILDQKIDAAIRAKNGQ